MQTLDRALITKLQTLPLDTYVVILVGHVVIIGVCSEDCVCGLCGA
jgi:hypothetical protein